MLDPKDPRAEIWRYALGCLEFPLKNPVTHEGSAPGVVSARFLEGDWKALNVDQQTKMKAKMKERFGVSACEFDEHLKIVGYMPIRDVNITVKICKTHSRCLL
jgi:hypothetical protein